MALKLCLGECVDLAAYRLAVPSLGALTLKLKFAVNAKEDISSCSPLPWGAGPETTWPLPPSNCALTCSPLSRGDGVETRPPSWKSKLSLVLQSPSPGRWR